MNKAIKVLFDEDQNECLHQPPDDGSLAYKNFRNRFKIRNNKVRTIIESSEQLEGEEYFHACIMFLHGDNTEDFWKAYIYGLKSIDLKYEKAKKFTASAYDKWLMYQGRPQKFGLQYVPDGVKLRLWDVETATTDAEREKWDVPPIKKLYKIVEEANKKYDVSSISMETKPLWLKDAIKRWNGE